MEALHETLQALRGQPLGCIAWIGADESAVDGLSGLAPAAVVLVQADPDQAAALRTRLQATALPVQLLERAVSPEGGPLPWNVYNLPALNGPLDAMPLSTVYPRLARLDTRVLDSTSLAGLLAETLPARTADRPDVLVLDLPGQEAALLQALPAALLQRFDRVVVRGCAQAPATGWRPLDSALELLATLGYVAEAPLESAAHPLWPVRALRWDGQRYRIGVLDRQVTELQQALATASAERDALAVRVDDAVQQGQDSARAAGEAQAELQALKTELAQTADRERQQAADLAQAREQLVQMEARAGTLGSEHAAQATQVAALVARRDELVRRQRELEAQAAALKTQLDESQARERQRAQQVEQLEADKARLVAERANHAKERATLTAARDEQTRAAQEAKARAGALELELTELATRHRLLQEDLIKAEAQVELIADVLLPGARA